ncbi:hypothetical protein BST61_g8201 [Cercospora zeina]
MDTIPGPKNVRFPHRKVPYICGGITFPRSNEYNQHEDLTHLGLLGAVGTVFLPESFGLMQELNRQGLLDDRTTTPYHHTPALYDTRFKAQDSLHPAGDSEYLSGNPFFELQRSIARSSREPPAHDQSQVAGSSSESTLSPEADIEALKAFPRSAWEAAVSFDKLRSSATSAVDGSEPVLSECRYDGGEFSSFPSRRGWDQNLLRGSSSLQFAAFIQQQGKSKEDAAVLIQSWLYFGMLSDVLGCAISEKDFRVPDASGKPMITLQNLFAPPYLTPDWIQQRQSLSSEDRLQARSRAEICFATAKAFTLAEDEGHLDSIPFVGELALSVRILGSYLETFVAFAGFTSLEYSDSRPWGVGSIIRERLLAPWHAKMPSYFCVNDVERFGRHVQPQAMYYLSNLFRGFSMIGGRRWDPLDHSSCSKAKCLAYQVDSEDYITEHRVGCDERKCKFVGPSPASLTKMLGSPSPQLPLIKVITTGDSSEMEIELVPYTPGLAFTAISHVWAEGKGNPRENKLPVCQLKYIARCVKRAHEYKKPFPTSEQVVEEEQRTYTELFWLDTLCVPRPRGLAKDNALGMIKVPYDEAAYVLVLGQDFERLTAGSRTPEECAAWILTSPWMKRLWTFQEGAVARNLLIEFTEGAVQVENILQGIDVKSNGFLPYELVSLQLGKGLRQMLSFPKTSDSIMERLPIAWNCSIGRTASVEGDQSICFAAMLGMDVKAIHHTPVPERTKKLYSMLPAFPQDILFSDEPKLPDIGFRWADAELMTSYISESTSFALQGASTSQEHHLTAIFPGFVVTLDFPQADFFFEDVEAGRWIKVTGGVNFPDTGSREPHLIGLIVKDHSWTLQKSFLKPKKAVLVTFNRGMLDEARQTGGLPYLKHVTIERYVDLTIASMDEPDLRLFKQEHQNDILFGHPEPILAIDQMQGQRANDTSSAWLRGQWSNPTDIFTILLIIGGDIVQKAIGQLVAGPVRYLTPVSFSFGWVSYAISAMLAAMGDNRLMPKPELDCVLINVKSKYARTNRSWLLSRLLRDQVHWVPASLPLGWRTVEKDRLEELRLLNANKPAQDRRSDSAIRLSLRVTVWNCKGQTARGGHDLVYWSGVLVAIIQIVGLGVPPLVLYNEYFTILISGGGTLLAWLSGALPQWMEEKINVRALEKSKDVLLTEGAGCYDVIMLRSQAGDLDLEALAGSQRSLKHPHLNRLASILLAVLWVAFLISVAGWEHHTWYVLGVGIVGIVHNVYVAGWERMPTALGIPLEFENMFVNDKVMKVLWQLETQYPAAGASALQSFFPGGTNEKEVRAWEFAAKRYEQWTANDRPYKNTGEPDTWIMPDPVWVDVKDPEPALFQIPP